MTALRPRSPGRRPNGLLAVALGLALAGVATGCRTPPDDEQLRGLVRRAAELAERHETRELLQLTHPTFRADPGNLAAAEVRTLPFAAFQRFGRFRVIHPAPAVTIDAAAGQAQAKVPFILLREGQPLPALRDFPADPLGWLAAAREVADPCQIEIEFRREGKEWQVRRVFLEGTRAAADWY